MRGQGYITSEQHAAAPEELRISPGECDAEFAPYFVEYVKSELVRSLPLEYTAVGCTSTRR